MGWIECDPQTNHRVFGFDGIWIINVNTCRVSVKMTRVPFWNWNFWFAYGIRITYFCLFHQILTTKKKYAQEIAWIQSSIRQQLRRSLIHDSTFIDFLGRPSLQNKWMGFVVSTKRFRTIQHLSTHQWLFWGLSTAIAIDVFLWYLGHHLVTLNVYRLLYLWTFYGHRT